MHKHNLFSPSEGSRSSIAGAAVQRQPYGPVRRDPIKRSIDILAALVAIIFVSPLLLICTLCAWADFRAWPFIRQVCVGQCGHPFRLLTFRTGDETTATEQPAGARKNTVGQLLAISNLDRLPELLNLLRGDLSLVGPRPLSSESRQYYAARIPDYIHREQVKPGFFGWAQLHEDGYPMDIHRQIQLDIWYVKNLSFRLDLRILRLSLRRALSGQD